MIKVANRHGLWATLLFAVACGSTVETGTGGSGGGTSSSSSSGSSSGITCVFEVAPCCSPGAPDPCCVECNTGGTGGTAGSGGVGGGATCGGFTGGTCPPGQYCDFPDNLCGAADGSGVCVAKPVGCTDIYQPTCGCNGQVFSSPCDANAAGYDVADFGGCKPPDGMFPCGSQFCQVGVTYCEEVLSDIANTPNDYACKPLPPACGAPATCDCLASVSCGSCIQDGGGLHVMCGGG